MHQTLQFTKDYDASYQADFTFYVSTTGTSTSYMCRKKKRSIIHKANHAISMSISICKIKNQIQWPLPNMYSIFAN